jgi:hypothetical protein
LEAPSDMAGMVVPCPSCGAQVRIAAPQQAPARQDMTTTVRISADELGGLPPAPRPRRIIVKRSARK